MKIGSIASSMWSRVNPHRCRNHKPQSESREADRHMSLELAGTPEPGEFRKHRRERSEGQFARERIAADRFPGDERNDDRIDAADRA